MSRRPLPLLAALLAILTVTACQNRATRGEGDTRAVAPGDEEVYDEDTQGTPVVQTEELIAGRFPGVRVVQMPGGGISVRVWTRDEQAGREPLYVVDGVPVQVAPGEGLYWLNPADIATIEVLKDVSETAFYGVRGGNGVVLITTRRGQKSG